MSQHSFAQNRPWTQTEDRSLKLLYQSLKLNRWSLITQQLQIQFGFAGRTGKQCRQSYNQQIHALLTHENWSFEEQKRLYDLHDELGNKWAIISQRLGPGRTDNSVKNHFYSRLRKSLRKLNRLIHERFEKQMREIQTKVLYKIIEASEQKFKTEPMCDMQTSEEATVLKNKILLFSYTDQDIYQDKKNDQVKELIKRILAFSKNYKRKPKKLRKLGAPHQEILDQIDPHQTFKNFLGKGPSNFLYATKIKLADSEDEITQINPLVYKIQIQKQKPISPIILTSCAKIIDQKKDKQQKTCQGSQLLQELGLMEDEVGEQILLRKKETSQIQNLGPQTHEQFKFFEDSQQQMQVVSVPMFFDFKKESLEQKLFN